MAPIDTMEELLQSIPHTGRLDWIGLSPGRRGELLTPTEAQVEVGTGLLGDHHALSGKSKREVTLVQAEHLPVVRSLSRVPDAGPEHLRRNLMVSGINLRSLKDRRFKIGAALFEGTGDCPPCSRMEENLGPGGHSAMRGHGGICARVIESGAIHVGDTVQFVPSTRVTEQ